jgi:hypothetical protein
MLARTMNREQSQDSRRVVLCASWLSCRASMNERGAQCQRESGDLSRSRSHRLARQVVAVAEKGVSRRVSARPDHDATAKLVSSSTTGLW